MTVLRTARLVLSPAVEQDAAFVFEQLNDPGWIRNIGDRVVRSIEDARAYVRDRLQAGIWFVLRRGSGPAPITSPGPERSGDQ